MTNTMDSSEGEVSTNFLVSADLSVGEPLSVGSVDGPVQFSNPISSSRGRDGGISISRVEDHSDLVSKDSVDPLRGLSLDVIVKSARAHIPSRKSVRDVHGFTDVFSVDVVRESITEKWVVSELRRVLKEWSVFGVGLSSLVLLELSLDDGVSHS